MSMEDYEETPKRTREVIIVLLLLGGMAYFLGTRGCQADSEPESEPEDPEVALVREGEAIDATEGVEETPAEALEALGVGPASEDPQALMRRIAKNLQAGDVAAALKLMGNEGLTEEQAGHLARLAGEAGLKLQEQDPVSEVGELEINRRARWALNLEEEGRRLYVDLLRGEDGKWRVEKVVLPGEGEGGEAVAQAVLVDSLGIADAFLQAVLKQEFELAKSFVGNGKVSDAKIAGLCIVFEEGQYRMRPKHPLRGLFNRETTAGFLANVEHRDGGNAAQFGVNLQRAGKNAPWQVVEVNLDQLLADYAHKTAGGDVYYTPLVKNPNGGDTLVLYFDFDKETLEERSIRQLQIVTSLLRLDGEKKIRISGHTDAFGTADYNRELSRKRAESVKEFLIANGVPAGQIVTEAMGKTSPRRPNTTQTGEDDPSGRRANRRTEIYLDF